MRRESVLVRALAVVLLVLGVLGVPLSLAATSARALVGDADTLVAALGPLASDARFQQTVSDTVAEQANQAITDAIGFEVPGGRAIIRAVVGETVTSDWFRTAWDRSVRVMHSQLSSTVTRDPDALFTLGDAGEVDLLLRPAIAAVRDGLVAQGMAAARLIPDVDAAIPVMQSDILAKLPGWLDLLDGAALWLPIATAACLLVAVLLPGHRRRRISGAGLGVVVVLAVVWVSLGLVQKQILVRTDPFVTSPTITEAFGLITAGLHNSLLIAGAVAAVVALVAWLVHPGSRRRD